MNIEDKYTYPGARLIIIIDRESGTQYNFPVENGKYVVDTENMTVSKLSLSEIECHTLVINHES